MRAESAGKGSAANGSGSLVVLSTIPKVLGIEGRLRVIASLDHSVWFHDAFDLAQPLLFFVQAQVSAHGRGLTMGKIFRRDGVLVTSLVSGAVLFTVCACSHGPVRRRRREWFGGSSRRCEAPLFAHV